MMPVEWEIRLRPTTQAPRAARVFVSRKLDELGYSKLVDDAVLIIGELVTNSVRETPSMPVWVVFREIGAYLLLEVWDCCPDPPILKDPDFLATEGRGLHIVSALSAGLGWDIFAWGKVVWVLLG
jgi:anti-sigma regulatory factor (Ser/Thr protein kinase)